MKDIIILEIARCRDDLVRLGYERLWERYGAKTLDRIAEL